MEKIVEGKIEVMSSGIRTKPAKLKDGTTLTFFEKGIKVGEEWCNINKPKVEAVEEMTKDLKVGDLVKITLKDKGDGFPKVSKIEKVDSLDEKQEVQEEEIEDTEKLGETDSGVSMGASPGLNAKDQYWADKLEFDKLKLENDLRKDKIMLRLGCLKDAIEYLNLRVETKEDVDVTKERLYEVANEFVLNITGSGNFKKNEE